jgi:hypothetical protein
MVPDSRRGEGVGSMKESKVGEQQIAYAVRQAERGTAVQDATDVAS